MDVNQLWDNVIDQLAEDNPALNMLRAHAGIRAVTENQVICWAENERHANTVMSISSQISQSAARFTGDGKPRSLTFDGAAAKAGAGPGAGPDDRDDLFESDKRTLEDMLGVNVTFR